MMYMMEIKCPHCGASHYQEGPSTRTAVYYPPIWKDGVNTNPDMNTTTTEAHCCECHYDFVIKSQGGKVWTEESKYNPPQEPLDVNITMGAYEAAPIEYVPDETHTRVSIAVIDKNGNPLREKTKVEKDIEEINKKIERLTKMVESLWEWNTHEVLKDID